MRVHRDRAVRMADKDNLWRLWKKWLVGGTKLWEDRVKYLSDNLR